VRFFSDQRSGSHANHQKQYRTASRGPEHQLEGGLDGREGSDGGDRYTALIRDNIVKLGVFVTHVPPKAL